MHIWKNYAVIFRRVISNKFKIEAGRMGGYREFQLYNILFLKHAGERMYAHYINLYTTSEIFHKTNLHKTLSFLSKILNQ